MARRGSPRGGEAPDGEGLIGTEPHRRIRACEGTAAMRHGITGTIAAGAAVLALLGPATAPPASAEGSFFDFLFGRSSEAPAQPRPSFQRPPRVRVRPSAAPPARPQTVRRSQPATPAVKPEFVVAVFGDDFAVSVARGLNDIDGANGTRQTLDRSDDDAGLTTKDPATWGKAIDAARAQAGRLDAGVVMLGGNDDVPLTDSQGRKQAPGSPGWRQLYGDRVAQLADQFRDEHVPLIWVGLPIVRDAAKAQTYAAINEVVQDRAVHEGAQFVDAWQPFADENGDFSTTGPDVDGRPATLRWSNGWNFTRAGAKKLASFLLPDLKRLGERARSSRELAAVPAQNQDAFDQALSIDVNAQILREAGLPVPKPAEAPAKPGPVLLLTAAPLAKDGLLASVQSPTMSADGPPASRPGRADDFAWPHR